MKFGITALAVCFAMGVAVNKAAAEDTFKEAADRLPAAIERARAVGLPFTLSDLQIGRSKPTPAENAADLVNRIAVELDKQSGGWSDIATLEKLALRREMGQVKSGLKPYQTALALAEEASAKPRADFNRDWDFGWKTTFSEYATMKQASRLLGIRAQVRAASGDVPGVLADLTSIRGLAKLVADERDLVGVEESMSTLEVGEKAAERVATIWANDDDNLARLQAFLSSPIRLPSLTDAAKGDFYMGLASTRNFGDLQAATYREDLGKSFARKWDAASLTREGLPQNVIAQAVLTRHIESWLAIWPQLTSDDPPLKRIAAIDRIVVPEEGSQDPLSYIFELLHVSETAVQAPAAEVDTLAREACTRGLVAALRFKLSRGHFPTSAADTDSPEIDPWSGSAVRYTVSGDQIRVYSVGPDGKDDNGRTYVELPQQPTLDFDISWARIKGDIVASYPALTPRTNPLGTKKSDHR